LIRASITLHKIFSKKMDGRVKPGHDESRDMPPMILIGQYDSPFVRRVAIALRLYGVPFEHRPWSTFGDADKIAPYNPLRRVPTLVLDGGEVLIESTAILDYLDELVGAEKAMIADKGPERRHALKICALATGLADKAVSLVYERVLRRDQLKLWVERCEAQIGGVLAVLEKERAGVASPYWFGTRIGHADIMVACALRFAGEAHPELFDAAGYPSLAAHAARCEALPAFQEIVQPLAPPSGD
jgi:glutathione S-transferase